MKLPKRTTVLLPAKITGTPSIRPLLWNLHPVASGMTRASKFGYLHALHQFWDHFVDFTLSLCLAVTCAKLCKGEAKFKQLEN